LPGRSVLNKVSFALVFLVSGVKAHPNLFHDVSREQFYATILPLHV
jgi:hypothetical protein